MNQNAPVLNDNAVGPMDLWSSEKIEQRIREEMRQNGMTPNRPQEYYGNGYRKLHHNMHGPDHPHHLWRILRPSWWLSFVIPNRSHYCRKCMNYMDHTWSTAWNDDVKVCSCNKMKPSDTQVAARGPMQTPPPAGSSGNYYTYSY